MIKNKIKEVKESELLELEGIKEDFYFTMDINKLEAIIDNQYNLMKAFIKDFKEVDVDSVTIYKSKRGLYRVVSYNYTKGRQKGAYYEK